MRLQDGDGNIPTQELGTALRALDAYPSVNIINTFQSGNRSICHYVPSSCCRKKRFLSSLKTQRK